MTVHKADGAGNPCNGTLGDTVKTEESNFVETGTISRQAAHCTSSVNFQNTEAIISFSRKGSSLLKLKHTLTDSSLNKPSLLPHISDYLVQQLPVLPVIILTDINVVTACVFWKHLWSTPNTSHLKHSSQMPANVILVFSPYQPSLFPFHLILAILTFDMFFSKDHSASIFLYAKYYSSCS